MKLQDLNVAQLRRAVQMYLEEAYPSGVPARVKIPRPVVDGATVEEMLSGFTNEARSDGSGSSRWTLRLGNERYPFMKLVLQEPLLEDELVFTVDTHDEMDIKPSFPDFEAWEELKHFNQKLRERIEARWRDAALDTCARLRLRANELAARCSLRTRGSRALVVDDEPDLAESFAALLRSEGYEVETAFNGVEALEKIHKHKPDIVLLDYEMPEMDGIQVIDHLRADPATKDLPVLLATASQVSLDEMRRASGFLVKPFTSEMLVSFIDHLLKDGKASGSLQGGPAAG